MPALRIIVVGAGIAGLSAAIALRRSGFCIELFERSRSFRPAGGGICMWPNGAKALHALGLGAVAERISPVLRGVEYRDKAGELMCDIPLSFLVDRVHQRPYPLSRHDLQAALAQLFGPEAIRFGAECIRVNQGQEEVEAVFSDGRRAVGDLLVAADGIRSGIRDSVFGPVALRYAYSAWISTIPADPALNLSIGFQI
jgi:2-polyprenyl-6-methoxyphenol hydroxylase-like FAD-dependent oxidoreductase